ncbi:uncharacterized protein [Typha angustifolia]|uniref:uncharacterized protein n=1 Tax=Typha angustifolia TaxID=59011 RepID=UPI003C3088DA
MEFKITRFISSLRILKYLPNPISRILSASSSPEILNLAPPSSSAVNIDPSSNFLAKILVFAQNPNFSFCSGPSSLSSLSFNTNLRHPPSRTPVGFILDIRRVDLISRKLSVCVHRSVRPRTSPSFCFSLVSRSCCTSYRSFCSQSACGRSQRRARALLPRHLNVNPDDLIEIVSLIREDGRGMEAKLNQMNLRLSNSLIMEVLCVLNEHRISALRFFNWVLSYNLDSIPSAKIYNQIVDNLGRLEDFETMSRVLDELSSKGHCLTENTFAFLTVSSSDSLRDLVQRVTETLNRTVGSCRGSGIFSLIKLLCSMSAFDLAIFVMDETARKTSYYNVLIAAKCRSGDFQGARELFDEMRKYGCDPNVKSYNYLLGCLLKNMRVVEACELLETMEKWGYLPDSATYELLAFHACKANKMDMATEFLNKMMSEGLKPRIAMHAAFIKGYFFSGRVEVSYEYVVDMSIKDPCSVNMNYSLFTSLLHGSGRVVEAGRVLHEMMEKNLKPNFPVYMRVMKDLHKMTRRDLASELKSMFSKFSLPDAT